MSDDTDLEVGDSSQPNFGMHPIDFALKVGGSKLNGFAPLLLPISFCDFSVRTTQRAFAVYVGLFNFYPDPRDTCTLDQPIAAHADISLMAEAISRQP